MAQQRVGTRAWATLALLGALYALSFIDRFILALLVAPLKADLGLSDVQLGLLFGTFFAIFYGVLGLPLARLADRGNRKRLIIAGVVFWSACTVGSAFARNYAELAVLRFGLAIGEAALTPAAFSMLTDSFPRDRRVLAGTIYSATGMLGASGAFVVGAGAMVLAERWSGSVDLSAWRLTFLAVGLPGFVLAAIFAIVAREPGRESLADNPSIAAVAAYLRAHARLYGGLFAGSGAAQIIGYAYIAWAPAVMERSFALSGPASGARLSIANLIASVGGALIMPTILRLIARHSPAMASGIPAAGTAVGALLLLAGTRVDDVLAFLLLLTSGMFLLGGSTNAVIILLQSIAPPRMRATFTALILVCVSTVGLGVGPPMAAYVADNFASGKTALSDGLAAVILFGISISVIAFACAMRPFATALVAMQAPVPGDQASARS